MYHRSTRHFIQHIKSQMGGRLGLAPLEQRDGLSEAVRQGQRTSFSTMSSNQRPEAQSRESDIEKLAGNTDLTSKSASRSDAAVPISPCDSVTGDAENPKTSARPSIRKFLIILGMFMSLFISALDQTIVTGALPYITADLNSSGSGYTWVGSAFALSQTIVLPLYTQASSFFGRKWTLLCAISIFLLGSVLCGCANDMTVLIAGRVVQGVGAGGIMTLVYILIGDLVSTK